MKIDTYHTYHGAALVQIAEHPQFTAINRVHAENYRSRSAFRVNDNLGVYLKYATQPRDGAANEYIFTFTSDAKNELQGLDEITDKVVIALICVEDRNICSILYSEFCDWIEKRRRAFGRDEEASTILVSIPNNRSFRVNMNKPRRRGEYLDRNPQIVPRNRFPRILFE